MERMKATATAMMMVREMRGWKEVDGGWKVGGEVEIGWGGATGGKAEKNTGHRITREKASKRLLGGTPFLYTAEGLAFRQTSGITSGCHQAGVRQ
jgi:hypothetical protein